MSTISAISGTRLIVPPAVRSSPRILSPYGPVIRGSKVGGLVIECSSRPQKKATKHHMKTRPRKTQPWDIRRQGPTVYPPLPPLPSEWTLVSEDASSSSISTPPATSPE